MNNRAMGLLLTVLVVSPVIAGEPRNPLFEQLRTKGLSLVADTKTTLPAPRMADGLNAAQQQEILKKIVGERFSVKDFVGKVSTAPFVYEIKRAASGEGETNRVYDIHVCFAAHGSLDHVAEKSFLEGLQKKREDGKVHILTAKEMEKRKLRVQSGDGREERTSHGVLVVLERVELSATTHTLVTRQSDSLLAAMRIDPRFDKDADFPNQWRKITLDEEGRRKIGPPHPYAGAGGYLKITRLHEPKGALFVEYHLVYVEPKGWFNGAEPLTAKLPAIVQSEDRAFRRELNKIKK
jgi:hypothetical protein